MLAKIFTINNFGDLLVDSTQFITIFHYAYLPGCGIDETEKISVTGYMHLFQFQKNYNAAYVFQKLLKVKAIFQVLNLLIRYKEEGYLHQLIM